MRPPFSFTAEQGHGRIEQRHYASAELSPSRIKLPGAQSATLVRREWVHLTKEERKTLKASELEIKTHDRYFLSSHPAEEAREIAKQARTHWSVENKNHYKKDVSLWVEDDHRHRRVNGAQNLALMRSALLAIIPFNEEQSLNDCFENYAKNSHLAIRLIQKSQPI